MTELFQEKYRIKSARLKGWDYSVDGCYFVTICTKAHEEFFGKVVNNKMVLSDVGKIVYEEWRRTEEVRENVKLDKWVVMPNHVHGILIIDNWREGNRRAENTVCSRDVARNVSTIKNKFSKISSKPNSLSVIVRSFKSAATKQIHESGFDTFAWQSRFHDRVIRDEEELNRIRDYIFLNPDNWEKDKENLEINSYV